MKKRNNRIIKNKSKKQVGRQTMSVFCAAILLVCQILLTTAPMTAMGAAVAAEDNSVSVGQQWMSEGSSETASEYENDPVSDEHLTGQSGAEYILSEDLSEEESAEESGPGETTFDQMSSGGMPSDETASDEMPSDEMASGGMSSDEMPSDEMPSDEMASGGMSSDEMASGGMSSDEMASDEMPSDEMSSDEISFDEMPSEEITSDETSAGETASDEDNAYESDADQENTDEAGPDDSGEAVLDDSDESVPDDSGEAGLDGTAPADPYYEEESVADDAAAGDTLPEESTEETRDSVSEIIEGDEDPESVIPVENGSADTDNDDIFAGYVCRELEVDEAFIEEAPGAEEWTNRKGNNGEKAESYSDPDSESVSSPALRSYYASTRLTGYTRVLYDRLLDVISQISAGERAETTIELTVEDLELDGLSWSAEDLGVEAITALDDEGKRYITSDAKTALKAMIGISYATANRALLADCPYDLYWYDKTTSSTATWFNFTARSISGEWRIMPAPSSYYTVYMPVSADYSADGNAGTYYVNTSIGSSVTQAYNNARTIVEQYSGLTDYRKLDAYRQEICSRTSYNYTAIRENADYGDPWQLIYALDDDLTNQVVCEGYSKAFQYLCDLSSFNSYFQECISVTGKLGTEGHMWNVVSFRDGTNYLVDLTNCDSGMVGSGNGGRGLFLVGTGTADILTYYCTGNVTGGYKFNLSSSGPRYTYDDNAFSRFGEEILTLSEGKVVLGDADITVEIPDGGICHDGTEKKPRVIVKSKDRIFTEGRDYTVEYINNIDAGANTAQVLVTALEDGRCLDSAMVTFSIDKGEQKLSASNLNTIVQDQALISVSGAQGELTFTSSDPSIVQVGEKDGTVRGVSPGTAKVTISAAQTDNYNPAQIEIDVTVRIRLTAPEITTTLSSEKQVYDGSAKTPAVSITDSSGTKLINGRDYTLAYSNNVNAGTNTGLITITGKGDYTGVIKKYFTISKASQSLSAKTSASTVTVGKNASVSVTGAKGKVTYSSSNTAVADVTAAGKVTAKKTGKTVITVVSAETDNFLKTSKKININVVPAATSSFQACNRQLGVLLTWKKVEGASGYDIYRGSTKIKTIQGGSVVSFQDNSTLTNGTSYSYKIYARASTGVSSLSRSVTICRLTRPSISSLKNTAPGKMTVTWTKNAKATKYQVQYSLYSDFRSTGTINVMGASSLKTVIGGLSRNRVRYVRIRTCRTVGNVTYTSMWSMTRNVKIIK